MSNELVNFNVSDMQTMANAVAKSGLFGMKTPEQALALMLVAQSENQHPATVTQDYDIIQGKACRKTHSVMARFQHMGGKIEWHKLDATIASATFSHPAGGSLPLEWTIEMAKNIGLTNKDNWKNYPRAMLRARLIAEGVRSVYPAAIGGMLIAEEAADLPASTERDMGTVEREPEQPKKKPVYDAAQFDKLFPTWEKLVLDKKKTAEAIISTVSSGFDLTPEQISKIKNIGVDVKTGEIVDPEWVKGFEGEQAE